MYVCMYGLSTIHALASHDASPLPQWLDGGFSSRPSSTGLISDCAKDAGLKKLRMPGMAFI